MSLNQKYTWQDFLKDHPDHKEKKTKRTSPEGKKAFETAYKAFIKKYLAERAEKMAKGLEKAKKRREEYTLKVKGLKKAERHVRAKLVQAKADRQDSTIARFQKQIEKTKAAQKDF